MKNVPKIFEKNSKGNKQEKWTDKKEIFEEACIVPGNKKKRCRILRKLANNMKGIKRPSLNKYYKQKPVDWVPK